MSVNFTTCFSWPIRKYYFRIVPKMVDYMIMMLILLLENVLLNYGNVDITEERVPNVYHVLCVRLLGRLFIVPHLLRQGHGTVICWPLSWLAEHTAELLKPQKMLINRAIDNEYSSTLWYDWAIVGSSFSQVTKTATWTSRINYIWFLQKLNNYSE